MRSGLLRGQDHRFVGALACVAEGPAAITLSRGGAKKTYDYVEENEDATFFAYANEDAAGGLIVAVADGHHGSSGSLATLEHIEAELAPRWIASDNPLDSAEAWTDRALDALVACNDAVLARAGKLGIPSAPTTLTLALVRPAEDLIAYACVGDSHLFRVDAADARDLGWARRDEHHTFFLGGAAHVREELAERSVVGTTRLSGVDALALATDGLSERGIGVADPERAAFEAIEAARSAAPDLRALEACKHLSQTAMRAQQEHQAGDNVGCAVLWLGA